MNYNIVKANYLRGLWPVAVVEKAMNKGVITADEFTEITGIALPDGYEAPVAQIAMAAQADPTYILSTSGTYHWPGCGKASAGVKLTLAQIAEATGGAGKPCGTCQPPALVTESVAAE